MKKAKSMEEIYQFADQNNISLISTIEGQIEKWVRDKNNQKVGYLVASAITDNDNKIEIGFSFCNTKHDKFDPDKAVQIAFGRSYKYADADLMTVIRLIDNHVPYQYKDEFFKFLKRAKRYFKQEGQTLGNWDIDKIKGVPVHLDIAYH